MRNPADVVTIHIPMSRSMREHLDARAKRLGFDSAQAYIRVWLTAEAEGHALSFGDEDDWGPLSPEAVERLDRLAAEAIRDSKACKLPRFANVHDMMEHLRSDGTAD
jgi:hypothetical protein